MNWQQLSKYFEKVFSFLENIEVCNSPDQKGIPLHPLIKISTGLALKALTNPEENHLVILFPNRLDIALWISTLCTLEIMKNDYSTHPPISNRYSKGEKLLVDKCVVVFDKEEFRPQNKQWVMWVRCKDGRYAIPLDRRLVFQRTTSEKPMSSMKKLDATYHSAPVSKNLVDDILGIKTLGNKAFFKEYLLLISSIGQLDRFLEKNYINGIRVANVFLWGKLDSEGNIKLIHSEPIEARPSCLGYYNLGGISSYISQDSRPIKGIIVDGSQGIVKDLQVFDDVILERHIPTVVVADFFDTESFHFLQDRGFKIWQWNKNNLSQSGCIPTQKTTGESFSLLSKKISNYLNQKIIGEICEDAKLEGVFRDVRKLDGLISNELQQLKPALGQLMQLCNDLSKLISVPSLHWYEEFQKSYSSLRNQFKKQRLYIADEYIQIIERIFNDLSDLLENLFKGNNYKLQKLSELINNMSDPSLLGVIVPNKENLVEQTEQYWQNRLPPEKRDTIKFYTISDLLASQNNPLLPAKIIVCGWFRNSRMKELFHANLVPEISLLLYSFELIWFKSFQRMWENQRNYHIKSKDFSGLLSFSEADLDFLNYKPEIPESPMDKEDIDIFEFEQKVRMYQYSGYRSNENEQEDVSEAKLVIFAQNKFSFVTRSHSLLVITDIIEGQESVRDIPRKKVDELKIGDYVLFRDSDSDIIREIVDEGLESKGLSHLKTEAQLWQKALRDKYEALGRNFYNLLESLKQAGCTRGYETIRNWLEKDERIGPQSKRDIEIIAEATGDFELKERLTDVQTAISQIRGFHHQASSYITQKLFTILPEIIESKKSQVLELDEFGQISILKIQEISDKWESIKIASVNRLLSQEDE